MKAEHCRSYDLQFFEQLFLVAYADLLIDRVKVTLNGSFAWLDMDYSLENTGKPDASRVEDLKTILKDHGCSVV